LLTKPYILKKDCLDSDVTNNNSLARFVRLISESCGAGVDYYGDSKHVIDDITTKVLRDSFQSIFTRTSAGSITLGIEPEYVDKLYRDCYHMYYSFRHFEQSRYCCRVFVFGDEIDDFDGDGKKFARYLQKSFIGFFVIRPTSYGGISRALITPKYLLSDKARAYVRIHEYEVVFNRRFKLRVGAFPYMMQDAETITCSHATILNIMDYYGNRYAKYKEILPSDIVDFLSIQDYQRAMPSKGISYQNVSRIFRDCGFHPRLHAISDMSASPSYSYKAMERQKRVLHHYVESAFPVAVSLQSDRDINPRTMEAPDHSVVCTGHCANKADLIPSECRVSDGNKRFYYADTSSFYSDYVIMDDGLKPYSVFTFRENTQQNGNKVLTFDDYSNERSDRKINFIIVTLPKTVLLEAENAYDHCCDILLSRDNVELLRQRYKALFKRKIGTRENPLLLRLFLASSRRFFKNRLDSFYDDDYLWSVYNQIPFPKFVWVCELYDRDLYTSRKPTVLGEVILDPTTPRKGGLMLLHILGRLHALDRDGIIIGCSNNNGEAIDESSKWKPFEGYQENLTLC
jgi:hypothetical protein